MPEFNLVRSDVLRPCLRPMRTPVRSRDSSEIVLRRMPKEPWRSNDETTQRTKERRKDRGSDVLSSMWTNDQKRKKDVLDVLSRSKSQQPSTIRTTAAIRRGLFPSNGKRGPRRTVCPERYTRGLDFL